MKASQEEQTIEPHRSTKKNLRLDIVFRASSLGFRA